MPMGRPCVYRHNSIHGNHEQIVRLIVGYDANALYPWGMAQSMPMMRPRVYRRNSESRQLELAFKPDVSGKQNSWLVELVCKFPDWHYSVKNGEQHIGPKKLKVDGYCPKTNTTFEFDGCFFHSCECIKPSRAKNNDEIVALKN